MADIKGIELASEIYDLEDTQGRTATQAAQSTATAASNKADSNETAIEAIKAVIPSNASSSNKLATLNDTKSEYASGQVVIDSLNAGATSGDLFCSFDTPFDDNNYIISFFVSNLGRLFVSLPWAKTRSGCVFCVKNENTVQLTNIVIKWIAVKMKK